MTPSRLFVLLPCESLEGLDLDRSESDAEQLLSAWSALWHPELLAAARSIPQWAAAATPPEPADFLAIVTEGCQPRLPPDWASEAEAAGARIFVGLKNRAEMVAAALGVVRSHPCPLPEGRGDCSGGRLSGAGLLSDAAGADCQPGAVREQPRRSGASGGRFGGGRGRGKRRCRLGPPRAPSGLRSPARSPRIPLGRRAPAD